MVKVNLMACVDIAETPPLVRDIRFYLDPLPAQTAGQRYFVFYQFQDKTAEAAVLAGETWLRTHDPNMFKMYLHYRNNVDNNFIPHWLEWLRKTYQLFFLKF